MKKCKSFVASKIGVGRPARGLASNDLPTLEATQSPFALLVTDFTINPPFDEYEGLTIYTAFLHLQVTARKALTASRLYIHLRLGAPDLGNIRSDSSNISRFAVIPASSIRWRSARLVTGNTIVPRQASSYIFPQINSHDTGSIYGPN